MVNKLPRKVKKYDVRGTGVPTNAHHTIEWQEYLNVLIATCIIFYNKQAAMIWLLAILTLQGQFVVYIANDIGIRSIILIAMASLEEEPYVLQQAVR